MMNIWIARNQKLYGPYPVELAHRYLQAGNLLVRDHAAWIKGMGKWDTLETGSLFHVPEQLALISNEKGCSTGDLTEAVCRQAEALRKSGGYSRITKVVKRRRNSPSTLEILF